MGTAAKIIGVEPSAISKIDGVTIASAAKIGGQTIESFSSTLCGDFDSLTDDYVNCGTDATLMATTFSVSMWVKPAALTDWTIMAARDILWNGSYAPEAQGWKLMITGDSKVEFSISGGTSNCNFAKTDMTAAQWHHLVITYDHSGTEGKIYLDGVLKDTETMTLVFTNLASTNFLIGARNQDTGGLSGKDSWNGAIDEVGYWNSVLDLTMVGEAYGGGSPADYDNLATAPAPVSWWRMGENAGSFIGSGANGQWRIISNNNA